MCVIPGALFKSIITIQYKFSINVSPSSSYHAEFDLTDIIFTTGVTNGMNYLVIREESKT